MSKAAGLQLAVGELVSCPYCVGLWVAGGLTGAYVRDPKVTRAVAGVFALLAASDFLHQAWVTFEQRS